MTLRGIRAFFSALLTAALVQSALAIDATIGLEEGDFFTIFIAGIIFINIFLVLLYKIYRRERAYQKRSSLVNVLGSVLAFILIGAGSILVIVDALVLITEISGIIYFQSAVYVMQNFFDSIVYGVIITGGTGFLVFLLGFYILILFHGTSDLSQRGMPTASGAIIKGQDAKEQLEPLNPTLTFRVVRKETDKPAPDVKVILKQRQGNKFHTKFTDFNGEVKFINVEGYAFDYYAYVEGDDNRQIFRVMQV
ncbi:MAG: hypothetical protein GKC04_02585 [Methanomicrobiales archaeon]|nr:hypothetical protein [Methanomicrobiales archaeon]